LDKKENKGENLKEGFLMDMKIFKLLREEWIHPLSIVIVGFCYYMSFFNYGISLSDEGFFVYGAERVLQGQLPLIDFISYAPGSYFLLALLFKVFGTNLLVSRFMEMAFLLVDGLMMFYISKRLMPKNMAVIPSFILIIFPGPWHKVFFTFGLLLSLIALVRFLEKKTTLRILTVGWCIGIALVFKFESGLFSFLAIWIVLFLNHILKAGKFLINIKTMGFFLKDLFLCSLGLISMIIPFILYYYSHSALMKVLYSFRGYYEYTTTYTDIGFSGRPSPLEAFTRFAIGNLKNHFFYLILLLYLYTFGKVIIHFFIRKREDFPFQLPVLLFGVFSLTYFYVPFTKPYLLQSVAMAYILFGSMMYSFIQKRGMKLKAVLFILVLLLGLYLVNSFKMKPYFYSGSISRLYAIGKEGAKPINLNKAKIYLSPKEFDNVSGLVKYFEGKEGYLMPLFYEPMVNFLTGLENPTRFSVLTPYYLKSSTQQKQVIGEMERYKIKYLLIYRALWLSEGNISFSNYAPILYEFVRKHYQLEKEIGDYLIFSMSDP